MPSCVSGSPSTNRSKPPVRFAPKSSRLAKDVRNCNRGASGGAGKNTGSDTGCSVWPDRQLGKRHAVQTTQKRAKLLPNTDLCVLICTISAILRGLMSTVAIRARQRRRSRTEKRMWSAGLSGRLHACAYRPCSRRVHRADYSQAISPIQKQRALSDRTFLTPTTTGDQAHRKRMSHTFERQSDYLRWHMRHSSGPLPLP